MEDSELLETISMVEANQDARLGDGSYDVTGIDRVHIPQDFHPLTHPGNTTYRAQYLTPDLVHRLRSGPYWVGHAYETSDIYLFLGERPRWVDIGHGQFNYGVTAVLEIPEGVRELLILAEND